MPAASTPRSATPTGSLDAGAVASIGTVGDSYDNAQAESLIGLYKTECVRHEGPWRGVDDLELATLSWVHWFNDDPPAQQPSDYVPPIEYESRALPSQPPPAAAAAGRTHPPLNPGRFNGDTRRYIKVKSAKRVEPKPMAKTTLNRPGFCRGSGYWISTRGWSVRFVA